MQPSSYAAEITLLRERVAYLEEELARRDTGVDEDVANLMRRAGLTIGVARVLVALSSGKTFSRDQLAVLCLHHADGDIRLVDSQIKRARKAAPKIKITTLYGIGYCVDEPHLSALRKMIRGESRVQAAQIIRPNPHPVDEIGAGMGLRRRREADHLPRPQT